MKKQNNNSGLNYLKKTGIKAAKDKSAIRKDFEASFGKEGRDYLNEFYKLAEKNYKDSYEFRNNDYEKCMALSGSFDADIIRKCGKWIEKNIEYFGKRILDVGCDCGLMSCLLASILPESEIISIDRGVNSIKNAEKLAESLGLNNINFISTELSDFNESGFDTVFSMRTALDNGNCEEDIFNGFFDQADEYKNAFVDYAKLIASKVSEDGFVVSIENTEREPMLLGWIEALSGAGLVGDKEGYDEFLCKQLSREAPFQTLVFKKGSGADGRKLFIDICKNNGDFSIGEYRSWRAKLAYEATKGELISGYSVTGNGAKVGSIFALSASAIDPDLLLFYQSHEEVVTLQICKAKKRDELVANIKECIDSAKDYPGLKVEELKKN